MNIEVLQEVATQTRLKLAEALSDPPKGDDLQLLLAQAGATMAQMATALRVQESAYAVNVKHMTDRTPEPPGANTVIVRSNVTELADRRPPVNYTIEISQKWDGGYSLYVNNVSDSDRSREAVRDMLLRIAEDIKSGELFA